MNRISTLLILIASILAAAGGYYLKNSFNSALHTNLMMAGGISGTVFRDFNGDGIKQAGEPLVPGVTVTAFDATGSPCGSTTTTSGSVPNYSIMTCTGQVRVEFTINSTTDCLNPLLDFTSTNGGAYGSSVQFVNASLMPTVNFALNNPADYNKGAGATTVYVPCYTNGNPLAGGVVAAGTWFVGFPYNNSGTTPPAQKLTGDTIGATWGVAYSKQAKKIFTSAFIKRHVGLGKLGSGGIYVLTPTATSFVANSFYNMDANGHRTRAGAGAPTYGSGMSYSIIGSPGKKITYLGAVDPLTGKPSGLGVVGTNAERGLPSTNTSNYDPAAFDQVGKVGLGDLEISDDGKYLFSMNLYSRLLYRLTLNDPYTPTAVTAVDSFAMPIAPCTNGVLRPYATKFYRDKLYIGAVCTGENNGTTSQMTAYVFELLTPTGVTPTLSASPVFTMPLNYTKGASMTWTTPDFGQGWNPWTDSLRTQGTDAAAKDRTYPTPILSDLEFTDRGDLLLSFSDRTANQYGWGNYRWLSGNTSDIILTVSGGDILVAGLNCGTGVYTLENGGMYTSDGVLNNNTGSNNGEGPGGDEFFNFENIACCHNETHLGAVAVLKGDGKVITNAMDPTVIREGGTIKFSTTNGTASSGYRLFVSANDISTGTFGKANGLGDIEITGIEPPLEIGNRVWLDLDHDGIQDPGEAAIPNVTVEIYDMGMLIGTDVTDASGNYYFDTTNIADGNKSLGGNQKGIQPNRTYTIRIGAVDWNAGMGVGAGDLTGYSLTITDFAGGPANPDLRDNDASLVSMIPTITYTTGNWGENNHTLDFGFYNSPPPAIDTVDLALRKTIVDTLHNSGDLGLNNGDTIKFKMQLFNQGKVSMDSLNVTDYLPNGFKFVNATNCGQYNEGWLATDPLNPVYRWKGNISPVQALPLTAATGSGGVSSLSIVNYDPGCGSNRLLLLGIAVGNNGTSGTPPTVTAVTFGGKPLTIVGDTVSGGSGIGGNNARAYIYQLVNPTGIGNINITLSGTGRIVAQALTFNGVDQVNPLGPFQAAADQPGSTSLAIPFVSAPGEVLYTLLAQDEDGSVALPGGSGQTTVFNNSDVNITGVAVLENGASTVTSSFNIASQDWGMGAVSIKPATFRRGDTIDICLYATLQHVPGDPVKADFTNVAEISYARDTLGVNQSANDIDSPLNNNPNDNKGGQAGSPADDYINGNGTGAIGGGVAATDQDNADPAFLDIFDLALKKTVDTVSIKNGGYAIGDTIQFNITITNQGTITAKNIQITDTLPCGFTFSASQSVAWSVPSPMTTYTAPGPLLPGQSLIVPIRLIINNSCNYFVNYAQISGAQDNNGNPQTGDIDGAYDQNFGNDGGGKVNSKSDDVITGDGTGVPGDEVAATDEDDQDPAELLIFDLALKKVVSPMTVGYPGPYKVNDLIQFDITLHNQGNLPAVGILVVDTIPAGLSYSASDNVGLNWLAGAEVNEYQRWIDLSSDTLKGDEDTTVSIFLRVVHTSGGIPAYTNISEIASAITIVNSVRDTFAQDADSRYDSNFKNDAGGQVGSPADNQIFGNGTGTPGNGVAATDEDDQDPALVPIVDVALKKSISSTTPGPYKYGDAVTFDITVSNQGTIPLDSIEVTDYIPSGFTFGINTDWTFSAPNAVRVIHARLLPAEDTIISINLILKAETNESKLDSAWINQAEISKAYDTLGMDMSAKDFDSPLNNNPIDNKGGLAGSPADDSILGDGTGAVGGGVAATDQDNADPAFVPVVDVALRKTIADTLGDVILGYGDTLKFNIQIFNQGNVIIDSLVISDYVPDGFAFLPGFNPGWSGSAPTPIYEWGASTNLLPGDSATVSIYLQLIQVGEPTLAKYTNSAEISFASDTSKVDQSANDADSPLNNINDDNAGGQADSPADNYIDGNGTGAIGGNVAATDQDNEDPAAVFPRIVDMALSKVNQSSGPFEYGDTVALLIVISNQGTITMDSIEVTDYLPSGLVFDPTLNSGWSVSGPNLVNVYKSPIGPGLNAYLPLYLVLQPVNNLTKVDSAWTNYAEISRGYEGPNEVSSEDKDSPWNNNPYDNKGGKPGSPADDYVDGNGTGMIGDGIAATDQDNHDPLLVEVADLALRKTISDTLGDATLNYGDTIKYAIQIFNQGNIPVDSFIVTDSLYTGLSFVTGALNSGWTPSGSVATYNWGAGDTLYPGESVTVFIYVRILPSLSQIYTNVAEISSFFDIYGDPLKDADSWPDTILTNDGGGNPGKGSDDAIDGIGTGMPGDTLAATDEDDEDPASFMLSQFSIGNQVWIDVNNNGLKDPSELGVNNVMVILHYYDPNSMTCTVVDTQYTDPFGGYIFSGLIAGKYLVEIAAINFNPGGP
ncbi:MAG: SdrD B-like domain-containing protein, partial [Saprospiraceae bacterium]